jgi:hypothetical protein
MGCLLGRYFPPSPFFCRAPEQQERDYLAVVHLAPPGAAESTLYKPRGDGDAT